MDSPTANTKTSRDGVPAELQAFATKIEKGIRELAGHGRTVFIGLLRPSALARALARRKYSPSLTRSHLFAITSVVAVQLFFQEFSFLQERAANLTDFRIAMLNHVLALFESHSAGLIEHCAPIIAVILIVGFLLGRAARLCRSQRISFEIRQIYYFTVGIGVVTVPVTLAGVVWLNNRAYFLLRRWGDTERIAEGFTLVLISCYALALTLHSFRFVRTYFAVDGRYRNIAHRSLAISLPLLGVVCAVTLSVWFSQSSSAASLHQHITIQAPRDTPFGTEKKEVTELAFVVTNDDSEPAYVDGRIMTVELWSGAAVRRNEGNRPIPATLALSGVLTENGRAAERLHMIAPHSTAAFVLTAKIPASVATDDGSGTSSPMRHLELCNIPGNGYQFRINVLMRDSKLKSFTKSVVLNTALPYE